MPLYKKSWLKNKSKTQSSFIISSQGNNSSALNIPKEDYKSLNVPIKKRSVKSLVDATKSEELLQNKPKHTLEKTKSVHEVKEKKPPTQSSLDVALSQFVKSNIELNGRLNDSTNSSLSESMKYSQSSNSSKILSLDLVDVCSSNLKLAKAQFQNTSSKNSKQTETKVLKEISNTLNQAKRNVQKLSNNQNKTNKVARISKIKSKIDHKSSEEKQKQSKMSTNRNKENIVNPSKKHLVNKKTEVKSNIPMKTHKKRDALNQERKMKKSAKLSSISLNMKELKVQLVTKEVKKPFNEFLNEINELQESRNVGLYVYCDACNKARFLPDCKDPQQLPEKWFCHMNPDPQFNSCSDPQVDISPEEERTLIHNKYNAGSVVWAKCEGYPWWPAMVDDDPDVRNYFWLDSEDSTDPTWYHVTFFDREQVTRSWIKAENLHNFEMNVTNVNFQPSITSRYYNRILFSRKVAVRACQMSIALRLKEFGFVARYYGRNTNRPKNIKVLTVVEERPSKKRKMPERKSNGRTKRGQGQKDDDLNASFSLVSEDISMYLEGDEENFLDNLDLSDLPL